MLGMWFAKFASVITVTLNGSRSKRSCIFRFAEPEDLKLSAPLNARLIREAHRNPMTVRRLAQWDVGVASRLSLDRW
jgi:hypothetical protein